MAHTLGLDMLTVAVVGGIGAGKTTTLATFAASLPPGTADGFLAHAGERDLPGRGAKTYDIEFIASRERLNYLSRQDIGYDISEATEQSLDNWTQTFNAEVLIIDEFGKWEAQGKGHWQRWLKLKEKQPRLVVIALQERAALELAAMFDIIVHAGDVDKLLAIYHERPDWERVGKFGAGAGAFEMSVGSAFHAAAFPLTGTIMAAAQAACLAKAGEALDKKQRVVWVAFIASALKAFSPAGAKLGAMLAISMQGLLFTAATNTLGWNKVGRATGGFLMGAWAALQGVAVQYILLGNQLSKAYQVMLGWTGLQLPLAIATITAINGALAAVMATKFSTNTPIRQGKSTKPWPWLLFIPTMIVAAFLFASGSKVADIALTLGRSVGIGFLLYALVQRWNPTRFIHKLARRGNWGAAYALRQSLDQVQPKSGN